MATSGDIELMRHALGVQKKGRKWTKPYRNHYVAGGDDVVAWESLVARGFAVLSRKPSELTGGDPCYSVTESGKTVALAGLE